MTVGFTLLVSKPNKSFYISYHNGLLVVLSLGNQVFRISVFVAELSASYDTTQMKNCLIIGAGTLVGILARDIGLLTIVAGYFIFEFILAIKGDRNLVGCFSMS